MKDINSTRDAIVSASRTYRIDGKRKPETSSLITKILAAIFARIYEAGNSWAKAHAAQARGASGHITEAH
jgi:hypothetical protein